MEDVVQALKELGVLDTDGEIAPKYRDVLVKVDSLKYLYPEVDGRPYDHIWDMFYDEFEDMSEEEYRLYEAKLLNSLDIC